MRVTSGEKQEQGQKKVNVINSQFHERGEIKKNPTLFTPAGLKQTRVGKNPGFKKKPSGFFMVFFKLGFINLFPLIFPTKRITSPLFVIKLK